MTTERLNHQDDGILARQSTRYPRRVFIDSNPAGVGTVLTRAQVERLRNWLDDWLFADANRAAAKRRPNK